MLWENWIVYVRQFLRWWLVNARLVGSSAENVENITDLEIILVFLRRCREWIMKLNCIIRTTKK